MSRRHHGDGSVYQDRRSGRWVASLSDGNRTDGTRRRPTKSFATKAEAKAHLEVMRAERTRGQLPRGTNQTLREFALWWFTGEGARSVKPTTLSSYQTIYHQYLDHALGAKRLQAIEARDVVELMDHLDRDGRSLNTIKQTRRVLHLLCEHAVRLGELPVNVVSRTKAPRVNQRPERRREVPLNLEEVRTLLRAVADTPLEGIVTIGVLLGLRRGEILALTWNDIDLDGRTLEVRHTLSERRIVGPDGTGRVTLELGSPKTGNSRRTIPLPDTVFESLRRTHLQARTRHLAAGTKLRGDEPVFPNPDGGWRYPTNVYQQYKRLLARHGLRPIRIHDLRHSAAVLMLEAGVRLEEVSQTLGHASIEITKDTYAKYVPALISRAVHALDTYVNDSDEVVEPERRAVPGTRSGPGGPKHWRNER